MTITGTTAREERQEADIHEVLEEEQLPERNTPSLKTRRKQLVMFVVAAFVAVGVLLVAGYQLDEWRGVALFAGLGALYFSFMGFFVWLMARGYIRDRQHASEVAMERHPEDFDRATAHT